jgi:hypothetical protein
MQLKTKNRRKSCAGFTLLEALLASAIGLVLFGVILQNYLSAKKIYKVQNEIARLSEDIRFANFYLPQSIMQAGFAGCRRISELELTNHHTGISFTTEDVIHGYDSNSAQNLSYLAKQKIISGTDVVVITKANSDITNVTNIADHGTSIEVAKNPATEGNRFLLLSDCKNADLFIAENYEGRIIRFKNKLDHSYSPNKTYLARVERIAFFISKVSYPTPKNKPIYSLYFLINNGEKQELIPEISNMQIIYGVATQRQGKVTEHLKAAEITNRGLWSKVLSVMIILTPQNKFLASKQWKIYIKLRERS